MSTTQTQPAHLEAVTLGNRRREMERRWQKEVDSNVDAAAGSLGVTAHQGYKQLVKDYVSRMANSSYGNAG